MVLDDERDHASRWAAVVSIAAKIGCVAHRLHEWVKKAEADSGRRVGVPIKVAAQLKALGPRSVGSNPTARSKLSGQSVARRSGPIRNS
jgi:hypothetical protein